MSETEIMDIKVIEVSRQHGYNRSVTRYRVEVSAFSTNVTVPAVQKRVVAMINALYPNTDGIGGSWIPRGIQFNGVVRVDQKPSTRADGVPWDYSVGAWTFEYETSGCD